jgi:tellurite methyltransferase
VSSHSSLLERYLEPLREAALTHPVLDLACGSGRNGLYLVENNISTVFADLKSSALDAVQAKLGSEPLRGKAYLAKLWPVDFEKEDLAALEKEQFGAVIVFRYLHRPLIEKIKDAIIPGGMVFYETFTVEQPRFGRPTNPDFLLGHNELGAHFSNWTLLHSFEGLIKPENSDSCRAIAQIVARKPGING